MVGIDLIRVLTIGELLAVGELDVNSVAHTCDDGWECYQEEAKRHRECCSRTMSLLSVVELDKRLCFNRI